MSKTFDYFLQGWGLYSASARRPMPRRGSPIKGIDADREIYPAYADLAYSLLQLDIQMDKSMTLQNAKTRCRKLPANCQDYYYLWIKALHVSRDSTPPGGLSDCGPRKRNAVPSDLDALKSISRRCCC